MEYFVSNPQLVKLDNEGKVSMCYCELAVDENQSDGDSAEAFHELVTYQLSGAIFS